MFRRIATGIPKAFSIGFSRNFKVFSGVSFSSLAAIGVIAVNAEHKGDADKYTTVTHVEGPRDRDSFPAELKHLFDADKKYIEVTSTAAKGGHFIHDTLKASGKAIAELRYFYSEDRSHVICLCASGSEICGHPGVNHGGYTAAVLDNSFGLLAFLNLNRPVTKSLTLNYKAPIFANSTMVISLRTDGPAVEVSSATTGRSRMEQKLLAQVFSIPHADAEGKFAKPASPKPHVEAEAVFVDVSNVTWGLSKPGTTGGGH